MSFQTPGYPKHQNFKKSSFSALKIQFKFSFNGRRWISDFQSGLINSKKNQKNIKFGLQEHINMENKMNGSDPYFVF